MPTIFQLYQGSLWWEQVYKQLIIQKGLSWSWSYGSWIYNYLSNQCLSPLMLWGRISIRARCTTLCDKVCQWLATGPWFLLGTPVSFTNKTDRHDITEILLKVALNTITLIQKYCNWNGWKQYYLYILLWKYVVVWVENNLCSFFYCVFISAWMLEIKISSWGLGSRLHV